MANQKQKLTSNNGAPVANNQNVMTTGPRGPLLMQDVWFQEKLAHFDREVIPERRMHAKGSGAYGTFTVTNDISEFTKAKIFSEIGKKQNYSSDFRPLQESEGQLMLSVILEGLPLSFTQKKETGI